MTDMSGAQRSNAVLFAVCLLQGGYMLFDGVHRLLAGNYFGGRLGPWAALVSAVGINPASMAPVFIVLGTLWLVGGVAFLFRARWSTGLLIAVSVISLAYLVFGTILSLIALAILLMRRKRKV
ncbi:MAG: hypothetical protein ABSA85_09870 [Terracidiphilus sp.]|jgi:hypothetical protein